MEPILDQGPRLFLAVHRAARLPFPSHLSLFPFWCVPPSPPLSRTADESSERTRILLDWIRCISHLAHAHFRYQEAEGAHSVSFQRKKGEKAVHYHMKLLSGDALLRSEWPKSGRSETLPLRSCAYSKTAETRTKPQRRRRRLSVSRLNRFQMFR